MGKRVYLTQQLMNMWTSCVKPCVASEGAAHRSDRLLQVTSPK